MLRYVLYPLIMRSKKVLLYSITSFRQNYSGGYSDEHEAIANYLDAYFEANEDDEVSLDSSSSNSFSGSSRFLHYVSSSAVLIVLFAIFFMASFLLQRGLFNFVVKLKTVFLILACGCTIAAEYFTRVFEKNSWDTLNPSDDNNDGMESHLSTKMNEEKVIYLQAAYVTSSIPFILRSLFMSAEAAFTYFDQNVTLIFSHELFLCTCRTELRSFSLLGCGLKMLAACTVSLAKEALSRTTHLMVTSDQAFRISALVAIVPRIYDCIFCFFLTLLISFCCIKIIIQTWSSLRFQQQCASSATTSSSSSSSSSISLCYHPVMKIIVIEWGFQLVKMAYYLGIVVAFIPDDEMSGVDKECNQSLEVCDIYGRFWSSHSEHLTMIHMICCFEIGLLFLTKVSLTHCCIKWMPR